MTDGPSLCLPDPSESRELVWLQLLPGHHLSAGCRQSLHPGVQHLRLWASQHYHSDHPHGHEHYQERLRDHLQPDSPVWKEHPLSAGPVLGDLRWPGPLFWLLHISWSHGSGRSSVKCGKSHTASCDCLDRDYIHKIQSMWKSLNVEMKTSDCDYAVYSVQYGSRAELGRCTSDLNVSPYGQNCVSVALQHLMGTCIILAMPSLHSSPWRAKLETSLRHWWAGFSLVWVLSNGMNCVCVSPGDAEAVHHRHDLHSGQHPAHWLHQRTGGSLPEWLLLLGFREQVCKLSTRLCVCVVKPLFALCCYC